MTKRMQQLAVWGDTGMSWEDYTAQNAVVIAAVKMSGRAEKENLTRRTSPMKVTYRKRRRLVKKTGAA